MTTVTLDVKDVEALLFSVNAIQGVENALKARDRDPMVRSAAGRLSEAHDRAAAEWRRAQREEPPKPSQQDLEKLQRMFADSSFVLLDHNPQNFAQRLQLVESGTYHEGVKIDWPAPNFPEFRPSGLSIRYAARLTQRGLRALESMPPLKGESPTLLGKFRAFFKMVRK